MPGLKLISATDTQYSAALLKSLNEQRSLGLFCDVTIIIQDKKFRAHKTILSASSTYFHQLFDVAGQVIELNFIKPEIFEHVLNYIYSSKIIRIRSDMLEELIKAGKILGVKFISNLHSPLSQVKGLQGLSQELGNKGSSSSEIMPVIAESFSISAEEFNQAKKPAADEEDLDDVVFVSHTDAQSRAASRRADPSEIIDLDKVDSESVGTRQSEDSNHAVKTAAVLRTNGAKYPSITGQVNSPLNNPDSSSSNLSPRVSSGSVPTTPSQSHSLTPQTTSASQTFETSEMLGVHKKQVATSQHSDFKIRLMDVSEISSITADNLKGSTEAKQTVTLDTGTQIDSLSSGCKVYANIGEDTYDIVQMKEDPGEGGSKPKVKRALMATPKKPFDDMPLSPLEGPKKKKNTMELEDHYEVVMDGKTFYVCAVCRRPYVCITSLRRHFNTHSWEKKYPCRFCNKVFALAEYRTKHEVTHTGERRYQCLICNEMFVNYQVLSNHCKQAHNQDACGRKEKDDGGNKLYRLLPCRSNKKKSWVTNLQDSPLISDDGSMLEMTSADTEAIHSPSQNRMLSWDDIFTEPGAHMRPDSHTQPISAMSSPLDGATEFEYITS
ncbi:transcriptional regulator Kaiso [Cyprinodon tularosa]|uniref:transcriptional regulator Kaiso n=1 Tax=Cyprinodon tularosa TaxID=77115 RepID=UPI0018E24346|nr:transcriptional regulator Kaiso [Cyprinodon tularosa]XP_038145410.1 transcriptional regulator Kaiso [Cyprinodon tularosa]